MYGVIGNYKDVTEIAYNKCVKNNVLFIPKKYLTEEEKSFIRNKIKN